MVRTVLVIGCARGDILFILFLLFKESSVFPLLTRSHCLRLDLFHLLGIHGSLVYIVTDKFTSSGTKEVIQLTAFVPHNGVLVLEVLYPVLRDG